MASRMGATIGDGKSLVRHAVDAVRDHIRDHDLKVGDTLPGEGYFAGLLGVSRAVMREAFGALAALKLIDVANGRRARVGAMDGSVMGASLDHAVATSQVSLAEIWDVRRTLEVRTAMLAAENRTDAEGAEIMGYAEAMAKAGDDMAKMTAADVGFHQAIARASHNALLLQIICSFASMMHFAVPAAWRTRTTDNQRVTTLARHKALAQAIIDHDPQAAREAMTDHFDRSIDQLLRQDSAE